VKGSEAKRRKRGEMRDESIRKETKEDERNCKQSQEKLAVLRVSDAQMFR
jgi:hypothetical protein